MNNFFANLQSFFLGLDAAHLGLGIIVFLLVIGLIYFMARTLSLTDERDRLQKDYAPRRKRVYQAYINILADSFTEGSLNLDDALLQRFRMFQFDAMLWSETTVVRALLPLQKILNDIDALQNVDPEKVLKLMFDAVLEMRRDLGFSNKKLSWKSFTDLVLVPEAKAE